MLNKKKTGFTIKNNRRSYIIYVYIININRFRSKFRLLSETLLVLATTLTPTVPFGFRRTANECCDKNDATYSTERYYEQL